MSALARYLHDSCTRCGERLEPPTLQPWCPRCSAEHEAIVQHERLESERRTARTGQRRDAQLALLQLPQWPRTAPREWVISCLHERLQAALDRYRLGDRSALVTGPSGAGKTTWCALTVLRYSEWSTGGETDPLAPEQGRLAGFVWTVAHDLVRARRETRLGQEPELIARAKRASVLVLDELGAEPESEVPFEIVDARYAAGKPTLVTSGLAPSAWRERYGDAMWRRLTEDSVGASLDLHGGKGAK